MDKEGTILEEDILVDFVNQSLLNGPVDIIVAKVHDNIMEHSLQSCSTISIISCFDSSAVALSSPIPLESDSSSNTEVESNTSSTHATYSEVLTPEQWRNIILAKGGDDIFEIYDEEGLLPNSVRMNLVKITCGNLVERYGVKVPGFAKRNLAQAIISLFPNLKDPMGQNGYEAFYTNKNGGEGYISWRLRTIARSQNKSRLPKRKSKNTLDEPTIAVAKKSKVVKTIEVEEAIEFKKNVSELDLDAIKTKMAVTYEYRKTLDTNILIEFPRFLDNPCLIEDDFVREYNKVEFENVFGSEVENVLKIYEKVVKHPSKLIGESVSNPGWDKSTKAILALIEMLPFGERKK